MLLPADQHLAGVTPAGIVCGAGKLLQTGVSTADLQPMLIGVVVSAIFGYLSVAFLLRFVQRSSLYPFVWYRLLAGSGMLAWLFLGK